MALARFGWPAISRHVSSRRWTHLCQLSSAVTNGTAPGIMEGGPAVDTAMPSSSQSFRESFRNSGEKHAGVANHSQTSLPPGGDFHGGSGGGGERSSKGVTMLVVGVGAALGAWALLRQPEGQKERMFTHCRAETKKGAGGSKGIAAVPEYTAEEVGKHRTKESRIWVTYKDGVYDITDFVDVHPGGALRIMLAAGSSIDSFWGIYAQHQTAQVRELLEQYRIGNLAGADVRKAKLAAAPDPYAAEPSRSPALIPTSLKPFNAETPPAILPDQLVTPNELFYVRNHLPVPAVDPATYQLTVGGEGVRTVTLSLDELRTKFKKFSVTATLQCTGNRRHEMKSVADVKGLDWDVGAISTAVWSGVRLRDVLEYAGLDDSALETGEVRHVIFTGLDRDAEGAGYEASIPVEKAFDPRSDVLLAYEMNGQPLPADHGFPVRALVPGVTGARSIKWVTAVRASAAESQSHWQQKDYKSFSPSTSWDNVDWASAPAIQESPVTSAICEPRPGDRVGAGSVAVRGYAYSGGGRDIIRVDVSGDGGATWTTAQLRKIPQKPGRAWAWTLWDAEVPIPEKGEGKVQICAKATDDSYNSQPETVGPIWNIRGVVNNAWSRVDVNVVTE